jgi:hypothetical protein
MVSASRSVLYAEDPAAEVRRLQAAINSTVDSIGAAV